MTVPDPFYYFQLRPGVMQQRQDRIFPISITTDQYGNVSLPASRLKDEEERVQAELLGAAYVFWPPNEEGRAHWGQSYSRKNSGLIWIKVTNYRVQVVSVTSKEMERKFEKEFNKEMNPWFIRAMDFSFTDVVDVATGDLGSLLSDRVANRIADRSDTKSKVWHVRATQILLMFVNDITATWEAENELELGFTYWVRATKHVPTITGSVRVIVPVADERAAMELITEVREAVLDRKVASLLPMYDDEEKAQKAAQQIEDARSAPVAIGTDSREWMNCGPSLTSTLDTSV